MTKKIDDADLTVVEKEHVEDDEVLWVTDFDEDKAREFCDKVLKASAKDPKKPLIIYIDSYGGSVDALSAMVVTLQSVPNKIVTVCMGKAMSAGAMLLSFGDLRYVAPHGRVMVHEVSAGAWGNINDLKVSATEMTRMNEHWMGQLAANCKMPLKTLLKKFTNKRRDIHMDPKQALAFGIADKIGVPRLKKTVRYEID